ncbi:MAG: NAD(P)-dependent oxidoreductase [Microthrixaceae bacterium]
MSGAAVGFVGLGNIGAPMARRLLDWPGGLVVYDVAEAATEPFVSRGATRAANPADLAGRTDVICVVVRDEAQVHDVLFGPAGIASGLARSAPSDADRRVSVVIHSTISAEGAGRFAERGGDCGIDVIDAPISGGAMGAADGTLAVMAGGDTAVVERCRGVLERLGSLVVHTGEVGSGTRMKIARNLITFASFAAGGEALRLAAAAGLDVAKLGEVVRHSDAVTGGAGAVLIRGDAATMAADDGLRPIFEHSAGLGLKDLELATELGTALGVDTPFAALSRRWLRPALGLDDPPT